MKKKLLLLVLSLSFGSYAQFMTEGFEGNALPEGWSIYQNVFGTSNTWQQGTDGGTPDIPAFSGIHTAYIQQEEVTPGNVAQDWLVTQPITPFPGMELRFQSRFLAVGNQGGNYKVLIVAAGADLTSLTSYAVLQSWTEIQLNPDQTQYNQIVVQMPGTFPIGPYHIAFMAEGGSTDTWIIDDVQFVQGCTPPAQLGATNITSSEATLIWSANNAQQWEVEVLPLSDAPTGAGVLVNAPNYVVTDLEAGDYKYYVRTKCNENNYSIWVGPFNFSIANGITGVVRYDSDNNGGCNEDDIAVPSVEIQITVGTETYSVYTNENGEYGFYNMPDVTSVTMQVIAPNGFDAAAPVTVPVDFTTNQIVAVDHCLGQADPVNDLSVSVIPTSVARPGLQSHYDVVVRNMGTTIIAAATATISFNDTKLDFVSAGGTNTVSGNTITFTLNNLQPFSTHHLNVDMLVMTPPENIGGEILVFNGNVTPTQDDATPADNTVVLNQTIVNSYDPNDITVHEGATIYEEQTDDYLHYTIRFQNMGTAEAIDVRVENVLDENLDWSTFEPEASSDSYTVTRNGEHVKFYFNSINLPYEAADEPGSHGYISYRIKPKSAFGLGDIAYNDAGIFFDFNEPVLTNEVSTEVIEEPTAGLIEVAVQGVAVYPNPVKNVFTVQAINETVSLIEVYDINGRLCLSQSNGTNVNVQSLNNGLYFVKVTTEKGITNKKIMKQ
jgi:uncharacterized repeat protein (TIGR01451 family)